MNITIYYLSKKIILQQKNQTPHNQFVKDLDTLSKKELHTKFELFINQQQINELYFITDSLEKGLEKFKTTFKLIYAAGGLIENNNHYLFIYRLKTWDLPKGKLDMGESPEEAAIRECEEECGITKLSITKKLQPTYHMYNYKGDYALKQTYWYSMTTQHTTELVPQLEENIERVEWFDVKQIREQVLSNTYPAILDVINDIL